VFYKFNVAHMFDCVNTNFTESNDEALSVGGQRGPYPAEGAGPVGGAEILQHPVEVVTRVRGAVVVVEVARQGAAGPLAAEQRGGDALACDPQRPK
jgi:hypothetical protein